MDTLNDIPRALRDRMQCEREIFHNWRALFFISFSTLPSYSISRESANYLSEPEGFSSNSPKLFLPEESVSRKRKDTGRERERKKGHQGVSCGEQWTGEREFETITSHRDQLPPFLGKPQSLYKLRESCGPAESSHHHGSF